MIAYIMLRYGMKFEDAFKYVQSLRPIINPNPAFCKQLKEFERDLTARIHQHTNYNLSTGSYNAKTLNKELGKYDSIKSSSLRNHRLLSQENGLKSQSLANLSQNFYNDTFPVHYQNQPNDYFSTYDQINKPFHY